MAIRISGFSGLDIDSLVSDLMKAKRAPLDKLNQQKTKLEWQREQYRSINAKLVDFRNNKLFNYSLSSAINGKKATVSGDGASAITVKAGTTALEGSMSLKVNRLATAASAVSTDGVGKTSTAKLTELGFTASNQKITVEVNGKSIELDENATIGDLVGAINASDAGVTAYFDDVAMKLSLTSKKTGAGTITMSSDLQSKFKLAGTAGVNAEVVINGITTQRDSNTFTVNGVEITLNAADPAKTATIKVSTDTDKIVETIKTFINDYNNLIDLLNKKLSEERYRNYEPLTADQKKELKDSEIELWEEKAKSGLLRNDLTLTNLVNDLRMSVYSDIVVNGKTYNLLKDFGIESGTWEQKGKLILKNEDQLRSMIESNPDVVMAFFTQKSTSTDPKVKDKPTDSNSGLFTRFSEAIMQAINHLAEKVGTSKFSTDETAAFLPNSYMGEQLRQLDLRISDLTRRLNAMENRYYLQFSAMEASINRYTAMSSSLFGS
jgi:flagellar hook-associated protein 2